LAPEAKAFFESPPGVAFLHVVMIALHICFTKMGAASLRNISHFLTYTGLDQLVAASVGSQHTLSKQIDEQILAFGESERVRLAEQMPRKLICVAEDETFHPEKMCLVAIDPVSNFIVFERYTDKRDGETWTRFLTEALEGLDVEVVWQTSDEAKGLRAHARKGLEAHHAPDLFHIQQELVKATSRALNTIQERAEQRWREAMAKAPPRSFHGGRLRTQPSAALCDEQLQAGMALARAHSNRVRARKARHAISDAYHPYDLFTGEPQSRQSASTKLGEAFCQIRAASTHLADSCRKRIDKAARLVPDVLATIDHYFTLIGLIVARENLADLMKDQLQTALIPGLYLTGAARREKDPQRRRAIRDKAEALLSPFHQRAGPFAESSVTELAHLEKVARECADIFQRSSSCVEGRNAHLARYHGGFHRLSDLRLASLTVIHNFLPRGANDTTPAERFFENEHGDLMGWLVSRVPLPARPHNRKKKARNYSAA
jgi:hypothetical protein